MRNTETSHKLGLFAWTLMALIAGGTYLVAHGCFRAEAGLLGGCLAISSGTTWAISATLPLRRRRMVNPINFVAASLATLSAVCLLN